MKRTFGTVLQMPQASPRCKHPRVETDAVILDLHQNRIGQRHLQCQVANTAKSLMRVAGVLAALKNSQGIQRGITVDSEGACASRQQTYDCAM
ncbi:hypothetical protein [Aquabacterium sp.]|uniref:hypothetical protein n=1 Tax=Aquabacterium sp. TaxID=1872578 RepID=UPI0019CA2D01|nr:hypothetical protein [Aquabacterium sp.]MBC7699924.1 hypothetical protein [Aquabacterium sp.]